jgi:hypothetical protein
MSIVSQEIDALGEASMTGRPTDERIGAPENREPERRKTS